jgi:hypothetical protein
MTEVQLAERAMVELTADGWDVYPEVESRGNGRLRADMICLRDGITMAVEVKTSFSISVIAQAYNWIGVTDYTCVAVPCRASQAFAEKICRQFGIGVIHPRVMSSGQHQIQFNVQPALHRHPKKIRDAIRHALHEEQKRFKPGNASCEYYTPFRATTEQLARIVREKPGIVARAAISEIKHHYHCDATAQSSLVHWARLGKVRGVRVEDGRPLRFFPVEVELVT